MRFVTWIKRNFYTAAFTVICLTSGLVVGVLGAIYVQVADHTKAADEQKEILDYLDCIVGSILLADLEQLAVTDIIDQCDLSDERIDNIREVLGA